MEKIKIGIIGLGLIGGSLLKKLREYKEFELYAVSGNEKTRETLKKWGITTKAELEAVKPCTLVFVCSPISKTVDVLDKLEEIVSPATIVSDVASVKEFIGKKKRPYKLIGTHPMAGTENQGFENSFKELFEGAKWVITPFWNYDNKDIELLSSIIKKTGAKAIEADAKEHDYAVALISHMPMIVSQVLFKSAKDNELAMKLAASGFRDMTRLAMSNTQMAQDMTKYNKKNIERAFDDFVDALNSMEDNYGKQIEEIRETRKKMYSEDGKNLM